MSKWKWNNIELEIDMEDYEFLIKYENAFHKMGIKEKELSKVGKNAEMIKSYCDMFYELFDDIFGLGTGQKLFDGKRNARICEECYGSFIKACVDCNMNANKRRSDLLRLYQPNREQRRKQYYRSRK